jgi:hypothetical protein
MYQIGFKPFLNKVCIKPGTTIIYKHNTYCLYQTNLRGTPPKKIPVHCCLSVAYRYNMFNTKPGLYPYVNFVFIKPPAKTPANKHVRNGLQQRANIRCCQAEYIEVEPAP